MGKLCQGEVETFYSFAHDCNALNHSLPANLTIPYSAFIIEVCDFKQSVVGMGLG